MKTIKLNNKELETLERIIVLQKFEYVNKEIRTKNNISKKYYKEAQEILQSIINKIK